MPRPPEAVKTALQNKTRHRILTAAAVEIATKGFAGANINTISTQAGYAKGTIYNYFPSKRHLMFALLDEVASLHVDYVVSRVEQLTDPAEHLHKFFQAGFEFIETYPNEMQVAIGVVYGHDREQTEYVLQAYNPLFAMITDEIVRTGIDKATFDGEDADLITAYVMSFYLGCCSMRDEKGKVWFDPNQAAEFLLQGLRVR